MVPSGLTPGLAGRGQDLDVSAAPTAGPVPLPPYLGEGRAQRCTLACPWRLLALGTCPCPPWDTQVSVHGDSQSPPPPQENCWALCPQWNCPSNLWIQATASLQTSQLLGQRWPPWAACESARPECGPGQEVLEPLSNLVCPCEWALLCADMWGTCMPVCSCRWSIWCEHAHMCEVCIECVYLWVCVCSYVSTQVSGCAYGIHVWICVHAYMCTVSTICVRMWVVVRSWRCVHVYMNGCILACTCECAHVDL